MAAALGKGIGAAADAAAAIKRDVESDLVVLGRGECTQSDGAPEGGIRFVFTTGGMCPRPSGCDAPAKTVSRAACGFITDPSK